jgi:uncharacterized protein YndB with AHSA1/START domain
MAERSSAPTKAPSLELVITRVFDAPRELVWKAWTERERVLNWLGPKDFTAVAFDLDPRPGGAWHSRMRSPEGQEFSNGGVVREVVEPEHLVYTFAWDDENGKPGREMLVTVTLEERDDGRTEMTFTQAVFESVEDRDGHRGGWTESFDRLAAYLASA